MVHSGKGLEKLWTEEVLIKSISIFVSSLETIIPEGEYIILDVGIPHVVSVLATSEVGGCVIDKLMERKSAVSTSM